VAEPAQRSRDNPDVEYEREDLKLTVIALAALAVLAYLVLTPLVVRIAYPDAAQDVSRARSAFPPAPRLQTDPADDLRRFRIAEAARLERYGWVDREHGVVHIPIEKAMEDAVANGIPGFPRGAP
jgi:hypothetical protein